MKVFSFFKFVEYPLNHGMNYVSTVISCGDVNTLAMEALTVLCTYVHMRIHASHDDSPY